MFMRQALRTADVRFARKFLQQSEVGKDMRPLFITELSYFYANFARPTFSVKQSTCSKLWGQQFHKVGRSL